MKCSNDRSVEEFMEYIAVSIFLKLINAHLAWLEKNLLTKEVR